MTPWALPGALLIAAVVAGAIHVFGESHVLAAIVGGVLALCGGWYFACRVDDDVFG